MLELQYYGLDGVEKENIDDSLIRGPQCTKGYLDMVQDLKMKIKENEEQTSILNEQTSILKFSIVCIMRYMSTDGPVTREIEVEFPCWNDEENFVLTIMATNCSVIKERCNKHIENFGLSISSIQYLSNDMWTIDIGIKTSD